MWKIVVSVLALTTVAHAETAAETAARDNEAGKAAFLAGDDKLAAAKFQAAADRDPQAKYHFNLCTALYQQGRFAAAERACEAAERLHPEANLQVKTDRTLAKIRQDAADQHIALDPDVAAEASKVGIDAMFAGRFEDAALQFRKAVELEASARYLFHLCSAVYQLGRFSEAKAACESASKRAPAAELEKRIVQTTRLIRADAAAQQIELVPLPTPETKPGRAVWSERDGRGLIAAGKLADARVKFRDAIACDPQAVYFLDLCDVAIRLGDRDEAAAACKAVASHQPTRIQREAAAALARKIADL